MGDVEMPVVQRRPPQPSALGLATQRRRCGPRDAIRAAGWALFSDVRYHWVQNVVSLASCVLYVVQTYTMGSASTPSLWITMAELAFSACFVLDYLVMLAAHKRKLAYALSPEGFVDLVCILPVVQVFLEVGALGFLRFLRIIKLLRFFNLQRVLDTDVDMATSYTMPEVSQRLAELVASTVATIFVSAGLVLTLDRVEAGSILDGGGGDGLQFHDALYFVVVTFTTVGYGDVVPATALSRMVVVCIILFAFTLLPVQVGRLVDAILVQRKHTGSVRISGRREHVVVCGALTSANQMATLRELLHPDHGDQWGSLRVVFLGLSAPAAPLKAVMRHPKFRHRVMYLQGNVLLDADLQRACVRDSAGVLLLSSVHKDARQEASALAADAMTIMRAVALKRFAPDVPTFLQLIHPLSNSHFMSARNNHVLCTQLLKHTLLAQSCLCPGLSTLVVSLIQSEPVLPSLLKTMATNPEHYHDYWETQHFFGIGQEVYVVPVLGGCVGSTFQDVARAAWLLWLRSLDGVAVVGVQTRPQDTFSSSKKKNLRVMINPGAHYVLQRGDKLFVLASDNAKAQEVGELTRADVAAAREAGNPHSAIALRTASVLEQVAHQRRSARSLPRPKWHRAIRAGVRAISNMPKQRDAAKWNQAVRRAELANQAFRSAAGASPQAGATRSTMAAQLKRAALSQAAGGAEEKAPELHSGMRRASGPAVRSVRAAVDSMLSSARSAGSMAHGANPLLAATGAASAAGTASVAGTLSHTETLHSLQQHLEEARRLCETLRHDAAPASAKEDGVGARAQLLGGASPGPAAAGPSPVFAAPSTLQQYKHLQRDVNSALSTVQHVVAQQAGGARGHDGFSAASGADAASAPGAAAVLSTTAAVATTDAVAAPVAATDAVAAAAVAATPAAATPAAATSAAAVACAHASTFKVQTPSGTELVSESGSLRLIGGGVKSWGAGGMASDWLSLTNGSLLLAGGLGTAEFFIRPIAQRHASHCTGVSVPPPLPVVIVLHPSGEEVEALCQRVGAAHMEHVQLLHVQGSALKRHDLLRAKQLAPQPIVVAAVLAGAGEFPLDAEGQDLDELQTEAMQDAEAVLAATEVNLCFPEDMHVVVELVNEASARFIPHGMHPVIGSTPSAERLSGITGMSPAFAAGRMLAGSMLDKLLCQAFFTKHALEFWTALLGVQPQAASSSPTQSGSRTPHSAATGPVVEEEQGVLRVDSNRSGSASRDAEAGVEPEAGAHLVTLDPVDQVPTSSFRLGYYMVELGDVPDTGRPVMYHDLVMLLLDAQRIPMGLYRPAGTCGSRLPYTMANPRADLILQEGDFVITVDYLVRDA